MKNKPERDLLYWTTSYTPRRKTINVVGLWVGMTVAIIALCICEAVVWIQKKPFSVPLVLGMVAFAVGAGVVADSGGNPVGHYLMIGVLSFIGVATGQFPNPWPKRMR
jgi:hypothetical protein